MFRNDITSCGILGALERGSDSRRGGRKTLCAGATFLVIAVLQFLAVADAAAGPNRGFGWFNDLSFDEMLKRSAAMPPRGDLFFLVPVDAAGRSHEGGRSLASFRTVADASILSNDDVAPQAASTAVPIPGGETPSDVKTRPVRFGTPRFDGNELKRWNVSEGRLPPGSEIHFREPSLWDQYRWQAITVLVVVLLQAGLIAGLLIERRRRYRAELETRRRLLEVAHLNRTATAGVLSASVAHELNQPLGSILLNTETLDLLLRADPMDRKEIEEVVAEIRRDDQRAAKIIKELSGFLKRKNVFETPQLDLNDVVQEALRILGPEAARKGVTVKTDRAADSLPVRIDPAHLQQVVLNLMINGMDAMQGMSGPRSIALRIARTSPSEATVSVSDNGPGIPEEKLNSIFETFYTTKEHGSGLGLSIARTIVEIYGGRIWAENRAGGGATLRFTLPLAEAQADSIAGASTS